MIASQAIRRTSSLTAAIAMGVRGDAVAQDPPQQPPPSVRVAVDVVPVDVSIIGNDGKPVTGLTATDFSVDVDGRQRRLVSAQYVSTISEGAPASPLSVDVQHQHRTRRPDDPVRRRSRQHRAGPRPAGDGGGEPIPRQADAGRSRRAHRLPRRRPEHRLHVESRDRPESAAGPDRTRPTRFRPRIGSASRKRWRSSRATATALNVVVQRECASLPSPEERDLCMQAGRDRRQRDLQRRQRAHADRSRDAALDRRTPVADVDAQDHRLHLRGPRPRASGRRRLAGRGGGTRTGDDLRASKLEVFSSDASTAREPVDAGP